MRKFEQKWLYNRTTVIFKTSIIFKRFFDFFRFLFRDWFSYLICDLARNRINFFSSHTIRVNIPPLFDSLYIDVTQLYKVSTYFFVWIRSIFLLPSSHHCVYRFFVSKSKIIQINYSMFQSFLKYVNLIVCSSSGFFCWLSVYLRLFFSADYWKNLFNQERKYGINSCENRIVFFSAKRLFKKLLSID